MEGNPVNLAHANAETITENPADARVTLILEDHADDETIHVRTGMLTGVQIPQKSNVPTTQLWTP